MSGVEEAGQLLQMSSGIARNRRDYWGHVQLVCVGIVALVLAGGCWAAGIPMWLAALVASAGCVTLWLALANSRGESLRAKWTSEGRYPLEAGDRVRIVAGRYEGKRGEVLFHDQGVHPMAVWVSCDDLSDVEVSVAYGDLERA